MKEGLTTTAAGDEQEGVAMVGAREQGHDEAKYGDAAV